jgi:hypothetical protein
VNLDSSGAGAAAAIGTYDITASGASGTGLGNYSIHYVNGTLTVTDKIVLTVTPDDKTRDYKKANPAFTFSIVDPDGHDASGDPTTMPHCTTTATTASLPGTYQITCSGGEDTTGTYAFSYNVGTLKVVGSEIGGVTGTPRPTATTSPSDNTNPAPLFALLICIAFGGLGLLAVQAQRKSKRA